MLVAPISKPDCSFSTHFHLLSSNFICFYLFPTVFTYSINFIYYQTSLLVLDCFYLFFIIKTFFFFFTIHFLLCTPGYALRQGQVGPGWANASRLALDPMQAGPGHEKSGLTLALLGLGQPGLALPMDSVVFEGSIINESISDCANV